LLDLVKGARLNRDEAQRVLEERLFRETVDQEWALGRAMGIRMAPTFVMNGCRVEGLQPYEAMKALVEGTQNPLVLDHRS
jgi:predicted DsbA family dithiol-disulfide isomerase